MQTKKDIKVIEQNIMEDIVEEVEQLMDNGAGTLEIFEYIEDNTDVDPMLIFEKLL